MPRSRWRVQEDGEDQYEKPHISRTLRSYTSEKLVVICIPCSWRGRRPASSSALQTDLWGQGMDKACPPRFHVPGVASHAHAVSVRLFSALASLPAACPPPLSRPRHMTSPTRCGSRLHSHHAFARHARVRSQSRPPHLTVTPRAHSDAAADAEPKPSATSPHGEPPPGPTFPAAGIL